jgi:hypothetical protein
MDRRLCGLAVQTASAAQAAIRASARGGLPDGSSRRGIVYSTK